MTISFNIIIDHATTDNSSSYTSSSSRLSELDETIPRAITDGRRYTEYPESVEEESWDHIYLDETGPTDNQNRKERRHRRHLRDHRAPIVDIPTPRARRKDKRKPAPLHSYVQSASSHSVNSPYGSAFSPQTQLDSSRAHNVLDLKEEQPIYRGPLNRQGTADWETRRPNQRLRFTVPLRLRRKLTADEENAFSEKDDIRFRDLEKPTPNVQGDTHINHFDIVSTHCIPDEDDYEIVTLTVEDGLDVGGKENLRCESHWTCCCPRPD